MSLVGGRVRRGLRWRRGANHGARLLPILLLGTLVACRPAVPTETAPASVPASPIAAQAPSPPPLASPSPQPTPLPPPSPAAAPSPAQTGPARVRVANTDGQGANMRAEPGPGGERIKTVREGAELDIAGPDREADGAPWRNVRDPSDGTSGWILAELLVAAPPAAPAAPSPAAGAAPEVPGQGLTDADRAYLTSLQPEVDAIGKAITRASDQMTAAGAGPSIWDDPAWRSSTNAAVASLRETARKIRAAKPGPNTAPVHDHAVKAADRADAAAQLLATSVESRDSRGFGPARTALLQLVSEVNAMNGELLKL